eukprot:872756-Prorocentrum_minimum.AAC.2
MKQKTRAYLRAKEESYRVELDVEGDAGLQRLDERVGRAWRGGHVHHHLLHQTAHGVVVVRRQPVRQAVLREQPLEPKTENLLKVKVLRAFVKLFGNRRRASASRQGTLKPSSASGYPETPQVC